MTIFTHLANRLIRIADRRPADRVIGGEDRPYLRRWHLIPRNGLFNVYLHHFLRSDDNRALHDHPWINCSVLLRGAYIEHTIRAGGIHVRTLRAAPGYDYRWDWLDDIPRGGRIKLRPPSTAHRVELIGHPIAGPPRLPCWTLFITGPRIRAWGFHCPDTGWIHWRRFTSAQDSGRTGPGCDG